MAVIPDPPRERTVVRVGYGLAWAAVSVAGLLGVINLVVMGAPSDPCGTATCGPSQGHFEVTAAAFLVPAVIVGAALVYVQHVRRFVFNAPGSWPVPPNGWQPPPRWMPPPDWPEAPSGWTYWIRRRAPGSGIS
jgi:hypothetical protein